MNVFELYASREIFFDIDDKKSWSVYTNDLLQLLDSVSVRIVSVYVEFRLVLRTFPVI